MHRLKAKQHHFKWCAHDDGLNLYSFPVAAIYPNTHNNALHLFA